jgi:hypothetical protein
MFYSVFISYFLSRLGLLNLDLMNISLLCKWFLEVGG